MTSGKEFAAEKRLLLILNPHAGMMRAARQLARLVEIFQQAGYQVTVHLTEGPGDGTAAAERWGKDYDRVVCVGGDGTLNEVMRGLLESGAKTELGYLPAGSTNDFANSVGLNANLLEAAKDAAGGEVMSIDAGRFNGRIFAYVAAFGAFTEVSYRTPQAAKNVLGRMAFLLEGMKELPDIRPIHMALKCGEEQIEGDFIFGTVSNSAPMAGLITPAAETDLSDGYFEVTLARFPTTPQERALLAAALRLGEQSPLVVRRQARRVEVRCDEPISWSLDGEQEVAKGTFAIENLERRISFVMPTDRKDALRLKKTEPALTAGMPFGIIDQIL